MKRGAPERDASSLTTVSRSPGPVAATLTSGQDLQAGTSYTDPILCTDMRGRQAAADFVLFKAAAY